MSTRPDAKTESARREFQRLRSKLNELRGLKRDLNDMQKSPAMAPVLALYRREIDEMKESLIAAIPKDVPLIQAHVIARRKLLATFEGAYDQSAEEAQRALSDFEKQNALFIGDEDVDEETGEIKSGT